jgi:hypothetical protein
MTASIDLVVVSLVFGLLTLRAMRRRQLREQVATLWVLVSVVMVVLSVTFPFHVLDHVAHAVGIRYGSDLVFFLAFLFMVVLVFAMSIAITRLNIRTTRLAQELALFQEQRLDVMGGHDNDGAAQARAGDWSASVRSASKGPGDPPA